MATPILLCDTKGMERARWLECRMHGPKGDIDYTLGGSDVSVVFGENPWTTPLELWQTKKGLLTPDDSANSNQKEMGNLLEPIVAHWYGKLTGNMVTADTGLYQHADRAYALANLDYRVQEKSTDRKGILECKTTSWHKAGDWGDSAVPHYYELQVRFYMAVIDLDFVDIACLWGTNPELDMVIRRIERDLDIEAMIFERLDEFIDSLIRNIQPTMAGVNPELAMKSLARVYGASKPGLPTIEFGKKHEKALRRIADLQCDKADLEAKVKGKEKEVTALSVKIAEMMGTHERGVLETANDKLIVDFITKYTKRVDSSLLKKNHPTIYDSMLKTTDSRKIKVSVQAV